METPYEIIYSFKSHPDDPAIDTKEFEDLLIGIMNAFNMTYILSNHKPWYTKRNEFIFRRGPYIEREIKDDILGGENECITEKPHISHVPRPLFDKKN